MKLPAAILFLAIVCNAAYGQLNPYDFYYNNNESDEAAKEITPNYDLFYAPLSGGKDIFTRMSDFNFSVVRYFRRSYHDSFNKVYVGNIDISKGLSSSVDYSLLNAFRRSGFGEYAASGLAAEDEYYGSAGAARFYNINLSALERTTALSVSAMNRKGRAAGKISSGGRLAPDWNYAVSVHGRWGRDSSIDGVFTDETAFMAALSKSFGDGHKLTFISTGTISENGLRSYATKEAFGLTGDNLYNPSWGYYNGKQRSGKVAKRFQPFSIMTYEVRLSKSTDLTASLSYRFGESSYSAFAWFRAETPYPDYYRNMPGYADNIVAAEIIREKWRNDKTVRQVDWGALYDQNGNSGEGTAYLIEERTEDVSDLQFAVSANTAFDKYTGLYYGLRLRRDNTHFYKLAKDLLGGQPFADIDQFLDDYPFNEFRHNDMRNPDRRVGKGDRFGYNYNLNGSRGEVFVKVKHVRKRIAAAGSIELGQTAFRRDGHYEKELFPGNGSYGRSGKLKFETYNIKAAAEYYFSAKHSASLTGSLSAVAPEYGSVFVSPAYTNTVIDKSENIKVLSVDASYRMQFRDFTGRVTGYFTTSKDEAAIYRYFDDIAAKYSDMVLRGIAKRYYGAEAELRYDVTPRISVTAIAAVANNTYTSDPDVDIMEDATQKNYVSGSKSYLKGFRLGGSPEIVSSIELSYRTRGWIASLTYSYMDGRYITPNPLWRMERAYNLASSPEQYREFVAQEKLPDVNTLGLFVLKSFRLGATRLTAMLSVNNLLGHKDIVYNGYEQMRIARKGSGVNRRYTPFDRKYLYNYGRTYYCSLTYKF